MLVHLIEDDNLKAERITSFLRSEFPKITLEVFQSYQSGLKAVCADKPDLIVLDMSLPTFDAKGVRRYGRPRSLGGYELMRKLRRRSVSIPVFVITQLETFGDGEMQISFEEVCRKCEKEFPDLFIGATFYSQGSSAWHGGLMKAVSRGYQEK